MKTAKILLPLLLIVCMCACITACAVGGKAVEKIGVDISGVKTTYNVGETVDFTGLKVILYYNDNTQETIPLSDAVTVDPISTETAGRFNVTVHDLGFSATFPIEVKEEVIVDPDEVRMDSFSVPAFVLAFNAAVGVTEGEGSYKQTIAYRVGDDNGFVFKPIAVAFDENDELVMLDRFATSFRLFEGDAELTGEDLAAVVTYDSAAFTYYFTPAAVGHTYTLAVSPEKVISDVTPDPVSFTFTVVDGWNVYTSADLSRMVNVPADVTAGADGHDINEKAVWDAWKMAHGVTKVIDGIVAVDDTPVNAVILHTTLNLTTADFPAEFFVTAAEDSTGNAVGCMKDWVHGYHRYVGEGETFTIYGNGFAINAAELPTIYGDGEHTWGYGDDYSNSDLFNFKGLNTDKTYSGNSALLIQDLKMVGNAMRTNELEALIPDLGGMIGMKIVGLNATVQNLIVTRSFIALFPETYSKAVFDGVRVYDSLQDAMFIWGGAHITLTDCEMKRAGGPLVIAQHNDPTDPGYEGRIPELYIDTTNVLENHVNGQEAWFQNNGASGYAAQIIGLDSVLGTAADSYNNALNTYGLGAFAFTRKSICNAENYIDLHVLMMGNGVNVSTNAGGAQGLTMVGDNIVCDTRETGEVTALRSRIAAALQMAGKSEAEATATASAVVVLQNSVGKLMWTDGENLYVDYNGNPCTTLKDYITAQLQACAASGGATAPDRSFFTEGDYLTVYAFGMGIVLSYK